MPQQPCECTGTVQCELFPAPQALPSVPWKGGGSVSRMSHSSGIRTQVGSIEVLQGALQGATGRKLRSEWSDLNAVIEACNWRGEGLPQSCLGGKYEQQAKARKSCFPPRLGPC